MVGRQIILMRGDIFAPATLSLIGLTTIRRVNARIDGRAPLLEIDLRERLSVVVADAKIGGLFLDRPRRWEAAGWARH
jgi:hypothetical protein